MCIDAMLTAEQLVAAKICRAAEVEVWHAELLRVAAQYEIDESPTRMAMWLAQLAYESAGCTQLEENLRYSPARLLEVFPKYFQANDVARFGFNPQAIGARVYANRFGNGDEASGDGYRYRGRGLFQLTFKDNYAAFGAALGQSALIVGNPDLIATPQYAAESAGWFWYTRNCNVLADAYDYIGVTNKINGGLHGLKQRETLYALARATFGKTTPPAA